MAVLQAVENKIVVPQKNHKKHRFSIFKKLWMSEVEFKAKHPQRGRWNPASLICIWLTGECFTELRGPDLHTMRSRCFLSFFHLFAGCYFCPKTTKKNQLLMCRDDNGNLDMTKPTYLTWKKKEKKKKRLYMRNTSQNTGWMGKDGHSSLHC